MISTAIYKKRTPPNLYKYHIVALTSLIWIVFDIVAFMVILDKNALIKKYHHPTSLHHQKMPMECSCPAAITDPANRSLNEISSIANKNPQIIHSIATSLKGSIRKVPRADSTVRLGLGEANVRMILPIDYSAERAKRFPENEFDVFVSELIALDRTIPDTRSPGCEKQEFPANLPNTSIIIVFHNEAWSTLLRTVVSVINRTPRDLLVDIILVDDKSDQSHLGKPLDDYLKLLEVYAKIILIRLPERVGLIKARLEGTKQAKGEVLTFLDAHVEVNVGWLEPLLTEIYHDEKAVVAPVIDTIEADTFEYKAGMDNKLGGFDWSLNFRWYLIPKRENERRKNDRSQSILTPTHAGGLFSIQKQYFKTLGQYDAGMDIWGAENIELSFRVWACGGTLKISTCSRVGHVFRLKTPYKVPGDNLVQTIQRNQKRLVEVWFDEWKYFFYKINPHIEALNAGDVSERLEIKKQLNCKPFKWFLKNLYPDYQMPLDLTSVYHIKSRAYNLCIDTMNRNTGEHPELYECNFARNQIYYYSPNTFQLKNHDHCLGLNDAHDTIILQECDAKISTQKFYLDLKKNLFKLNSDKSLCLKGNIVAGENQVIRATPCKADMIWDFVPVFQNITLS